LEKARPISYIGRISLPNVTAVNRSIFNDQPDKPEHAPRSPNAGKIVQRVESKNPERNGMSCCRVVSHMMREAAGSGAMPHCSRAVRRGIATARSPFNLPFYEFTLQPLEVDSPAAGTGQYREK
jgi:hypothetical protein